MGRWTAKDVEALSTTTVPAQKPQGWGNPQPEAKKRPGDPESQMQQAFIRAFALIYPREWSAKRLHSVPNGGKRTKGVAGKMKAEGQVSGVWDLQLTIARGNYAGLWLEAKAPGGYLSPEQKAFQAEHGEMYAWAVFRTVEEGLKAVAEYLALPASFNSINY